ncbi:hypothetical protein ACFYPA_36590 [Streptomyces sp. NPDC005775]|uniref:hypothetical protein n=1 Tax=Streptomyces sp. NPDC005775 TaxID=3364729 RepID=UPI003673D83B
MNTTERAHSQTLAVRRPDDVPATAPLSWVVEQHARHADRLMNNALPADFPHEVERGDAGDALAVLALRESIRREMEHGRGNRVHEALTLGATWSQVAAALDVRVSEARALLRAYADGQQRLYRSGVADGQARPFGLDEEQHAAVVALIELGDEETVITAV